MASWDRFKPYSRLHPAITDALRKAYAHWVEHGEPIPRDELVFHVPAVEPWLVNGQGPGGLLFDQVSSPAASPTPWGLLYLPRGDGHERDLTRLDKLLRLASARYRPGSSQYALGPDELEDIFGGLDPVGLEKVVRRLQSLARFTNFSLNFAQKVVRLGIGPHLLKTPDLETWFEQKFADLSRVGPVGRFGSGPIEVPFKVRLKRVAAENFRVLGQSFALDLAPLTILTGPNASGKSTALDAMQLVGRVAREGLAEAVADEGGISRIVSFSNPRKSVRVSADFEVVRSKRVQAASYGLEFEALGGMPGLVHEELVVEENGAPRPVISSERGVVQSLAKSNALETRYVTPQETGLELATDPERQPLPAQLRAALSGVWLVDRDPMLTVIRRGFAFNDRRRPRDRSAISLPSIIKHLYDDDGERAQKLGSYLHGLIPRVSKVSVDPKAEPDQDEIDRMFEVLVHETGVDRPLRIDEISAGTRQMLALCAINLDPEPPSLLLLEEPDGGVHPGSMPALRDLLRSLSTKMTVVATSHSPAFVSLFDPDKEVRALSRGPEGVSVETFAKKRSDRSWMESFDPAEAFVRIAWERSDG